MKNHFRKLIMGLALSLLVTASLSACSRNGQETLNGQETIPSATLPSGQGALVDDFSPIQVIASFPDGAQALGQMAALAVVLKTPGIAATDMTLLVDLPDGFELVSGSLSWQGSIPIDSEVTAIEAVVRSVEVGNWTIAVTSSLDHNKHAGFGGTGHYDIYVMVSKDSAEWGGDPPWGHISGNRVPIEQTTPGEVEPSPSSQEEPPIEDLPDPPGITLDGVVHY